MKVLFVWMNDSGEGTIPLGISSLSAYLKEHGHQTSLFDTTFCKYDKGVMREYREKIGIVKRADLESFGVRQEEVDIQKKFQESIDAFQPGLIAFSATSYAFQLGVDLLHEINVKNIPVIFGGPHSTVAPDASIAPEQIDYICVGEGEGALLELCNQLESGGDTTNIKNIWAKKEGEVFKNELRGPVDLDTLPFIDVSIFSEKHHFKPFVGKVYRIGYMELSRGCPYNCTFCMARYLKETYEGQYYRRKNEERVIDELLRLKNEYNINMIRFWDETFLAIQIERLEKFAKLYKEKINLPFIIGTRPETITEKKVAIIKDMGCVAVSIGIESGNERIRREILDRKYTNEHIIRAFKLTKEAGIRRSSFIIIGIPTETRENIFETIEITRKVKADSVGMSYLMPYPGTKIRDYCIQHGYLEENAPIIDKSDGSTLKLPTISSEELRGLFETFYLYLRAPKWLYPLIEMCEKKEPGYEKLYDILISRFGNLQK